jgi:hypothetical protein
MSNPYDDAGRQVERLIAKLQGCGRATTRAQLLRDLAVASDRQARAASQSMSPAVAEVLALRTAVIEALAEVESARNSHQERLPAQRRVEHGAKGILDRLASRVTRDEDRPGVMREDLYPALVRWVGQDAAHVVLVIADTLPAAAAKPAGNDPSDGTLF